MAWTSPRTWVANAIVTAAQLNTHLRDNLTWLYSAKHGLFGRLAALDVPTGTWTPIGWDFDVEQSPTMWAASPYPERITPPLGGIWLVSLNVRLGLAADPPRMARAMETWRALHRAITRRDVDEVLSTAVRRMELSRDAAAHAALPQG